MDYTIATGVTAIGSGDVAPVSGTKGEFTSGVPGVTPATVLPGYQMNALVEEDLNIIQAAGLTPSNTNNAQVLQALRTLFRGQGMAKFSTSGANSWTCPAGVYFVRSQLWGAGGGGGGAASSGGGAGGGGGGAFTMGVFPVVPGTVYTITIGAGGAGGANTGGGGGIGGTSSFASFCTATGGGSGAGVGGGSGGGGTAGAASGGTVNLNGQSGGGGSASVGTGGGGGGSFGIGGQASIGGGPGGNIGPFAVGGNGGGGASQAGGAGANGYCILEW